MDGRDIVDNTSAGVGVELLQSNASNDVEDANSQSVANDCVTDYENDDLSNKDENDITASNSLPDNQLTEVLSGLLSVSNRDDVLVDGSNGRSVPVVQNLVCSSDTRTTKLTLVDNLTRQGPVDGNHEHLSIHLPSHGCISPSEDFDDDRDPNYATQRPDTLGAINVPAAASAFSGPVAKPVYQVAAPLRAWPVESAAEDSLLTDGGTAHLGRRTCGAGMDQLELNQRQLMNNDDNDGSDDDGEGSELCDDDDDGDDDNDDDDTGLGSAKQCESTEADQYKMAPEADQSAGTVDILSTELQESSSVLVIADDVRFGACGCTLGQRHQTDGAVSDVSHDMDDPEEDQVERATVSVENATLEPAASLYVQKPLDAVHAVPVVSDEYKHRALKQHPQSAFSIPKPRLPKNKPGESDSASCSNRPVPSVRHSKSNTDIVFKPINTSVGKSNSVPRTLITSKGLSATGTIHGKLMHHTADRGHLSALNTGISHEEKDADGDIELNHHPSKSAEASGRSTWSSEPLCNTMDQAVADWNNAHSSIFASLPSACHFPSEGGYIAAGTFAPAISSREQATPQKTDAHACRVLEKSLDMSPIHPASSSSRPLSANGLHAGDLASVSGIYPGTELYFGTQGLPPQYSHKVRLSYLFIYLMSAGYAK